MAETDQKNASSGSRVKMIVMVAAILVVEAALIIGVMMLAGGPPEVEAGVPGMAIELAEDERIVEVPLIDAKLPNNRSGVTYLYDTQIYIQVKRRYQNRVSLELEQFQNEIRSEIGAIWRTSEPHHFQEPRLETLGRKVEALLHDRLGVDEERGEPIVQKVVIVMGTGFRIDS